MGKNINRLNAVNSTLLLPNLELAFAHSFPRILLLCMRLMLVIPTFLIKRMT